MADQEQVEGVIGADAVDEQETGSSEPSEGVEGVIAEEVPHEAEEALAEAAPSELEELRGELEEARAQAAEYLDGWQRAQAEFSNYKKRQDAERSQMIAMASADLLRKLLPVVDDFERAVDTLPENLEQGPWVEGLLMIEHKLDVVLESEAVEQIKCEGQTFDPRYHEAVTYERVEGYEEGQIIGEVRQGYLLGDRVLRPALVRVAQAPATQPGQERDAPGAEEAEMTETKE